jgi:antitoxin (DNA-binding transcriptional repressor) of toxin-antitoxin stability system
MRTMSVGEFKAHFSQVLKDVENGEKIGITFGRKKEVKAFLVPSDEQKEPRKLGILEGRGKVVFKDDFKITEEELLGL